MDVAEHKTGYRPSQHGMGHYAHLFFNGNKRKYKQWEVKFLVYMRLHKLKDVILRHRNDSSGVAP